ncbi:MAG TPA: glycosyltransferase family 2 protein [Verrucomicrobiae bacterium]|nr:glycosyltransferase family 2 protein [Verrucomicrobiae bacterium]
MSKLPSISVITPTFNSARTLRQTLQSVREQGYSNVEHLVIDGGSTDATIEILKQAPAVKWISEKDFGIYDAVNKGILRSTGEIIGILNSDDRYRSGALLKVGEAFAMHPEWDALFGDIVYIDAEGHEIYRRREAKYDYDVLRLSRVCYISHPTLFVRRRVHDQLGAYRNEEYPRCADYDFILQLGKHRLRVGHLREFLADFRYHEFGQTSDLRVIASMEGERQRIFSEHGVPGGRYGQVLRLMMIAGRQLQKLLYRGTIDWRRGTSILKRHRFEKGAFSTNIPMETIKDG